MKISRPCYDKYRRCPGWAGPGLHFNKSGKDWCANGSVKIEGWLWKWRIHRCNKCKTFVLPYMVRWLDPSWWRCAWKMRRMDREL